MLESWSIQVSKALQRYTIDWQTSWLGKTFQNNSRNQAASRTTNENRQRHDGVSTTPNANRERILNFAPHYTEMLNCARVDVSWQRVLPVDSGGQQAEATLMDTTTSFEDVIWTDESTIQLESHRRFACKKCGEAPRPKPRYTN